jgi:nitrate reductase gamma subunit
MECHSTVNSGDEEALRSICFHCHAGGETEASKTTGKKVAPLDPGDYDSTPHAGMACTECHPQATRFSHHRQEPADCTRCHEPHDEKVAHELHGLVTCGACHLGGVKPVRDEASKQIVWEKTLKAGEYSQIHDMVTRFNDKTCQKCHGEGNRIGAASTLLPPKSILCMPCHAATFSVKDTITIVTILVFMAGMIMMFAYVFTGAKREKSVQLHPNRGYKTGTIAKALFMDVLLQRRLYIQSRKRWFIHGLIFYPFMVRCLWGLAGLIGSLWKPELSWVWAALDKNRPLNAFFFDLTGIMIILGVVLALIRGAGEKQYGNPGYLKQDRLALVLIGAIVLAGFILEAMRIAMTGYPPGSPWSFVGYVLGIFCTGLALTGSYAYAWYFHAILTGAFIAYIPFSRLAHVIIAPVVLAMNAGRGH